MFAIEDLIALVRAPLGGLGFTKSSGYVFTSLAGSECLGWLGLNHGVEPRRGVEVNPVIGVRHQQVERIVASLLGEPFHASLPPTISLPLSVLTPEAPALWTFFVDGDIDATAGSMVTTIEQAALPFVARTTTLPDLLACAERGWGHSLDVRVPVLLALLGEHDRATAAVARTLGGLGSRDDPHARWFRGYAAAFRPEALPRF